MGACPAVRAFRLSSAAGDQNWQPMMPKAWVRLGAGPVPRWSWRCPAGNRANLA
jgi:hypothetical protein